MEEEIIIISHLNDFIFCPASIYFHKLYGSMDKMMYQSEYQLNGTDVHKNVDEGKYSTRKSILSGIDVYTERYNIVGKIDIFDADSGELIERKKHISHIYDGYVFQVYAQYYALKEMGYNVKKIRIHSIDDNKSYDIKLPEQDSVMCDKFNQVVKEMTHFSLDTYVQENVEKCKKCIYELLCDRSIKDNDRCG